MLLLPGHPIHPLKYPPPLGMALFFKLSAMANKKKRSCPVTHPICLRRMIKLCLLCSLRSLQSPYCDAGHDALPWSWCHNSATVVGSSTNATPVPCYNHTHTYTHIPMRHLVFGAQPTKKQSSKAFCYFRTLQQDLISRGHLMADRVMSCCWVKEVPTVWVSMIGREREKNWMK